MAWKPPAPISLKLAHRLEKVDALAEARGLTRHGAILAMIDEHGGAGVKPAQVVVIAGHQSGKTAALQGPTVAEKPILADGPPLAAKSEARPSLDLQFGPRRAAFGERSKPR